MNPGDPVFEELCETLRLEASEQVERIGTALVDLEGGVPGEQRVELLQEAFRQAHNLKGAASSLGFTVASRLAHVLESLLDDLRVTRDADAGPLLDAVHEGLGAVSDALAAGPQAADHTTVSPLIASLEEVHQRFRTASGSVPPEGEAASRPELDLLTDPDRIGTQLARTPPRVSIDGGAEPREPTAAVDIRPTVDETLRVSLRKLDALMAQVGELLAARLRTDQRLEELRTVLAAEEARLSRREALRSMVRDSAPAVVPAWAQRLVDALEEGTAHQQELVRHLRDLVRAFQADALHSTILSGELQEDIRRIQTFPLASVLSTLPRALRNMAHEADKDARLVIEGAEVELDKKVLEALRDPLYHLMRNAVDHGVEPPHVRRSRGKPTRGTIRIGADHRGNQIAIAVADDGPGIDLDAVRRRAVERGLVAAGSAKDIPEHRLLALLFSPGFTTRRATSSMSGRGIGLDSVRSAVEALHGAVSIHSDPGRGTTVLIALPLTVYVVQGLVLRVGQHVMAIPISAIHRILRVTPAEVLAVEQSEVVIIDDRPVAVMPLASVLGITADGARGQDRISVIVLSAGEQLFALSIDEIIGDQTLLAKSFEPPLVRIRNIGGATVLGDGRVVLMLNPIDLLRSVSTREADQWVVPKQAPRARPRVLLADDSLTTRALERSVLETAGFEVVAVADGAEAFGMLDQHPDFDAVVSDVSMPRLDGIELCQRIRASERLRGLPVILVTSLGSDADRQRGLAAGADAYVVKSEFDHEKLVAEVNLLLGRM